jgi:hypothetical protein
VSGISKNFPHNFQRNPFSLLGTQALVRSGSPNSSLSADDKATSAVICRAKAISDSSHFPFDKETLKFKVSEQGENFALVTAAGKFSIDCLHEKAQAIFDLLLYL